MRGSIDHARYAPLLTFPPVKNGERGNDEGRSLAKRVRK